MFIYFAQTLQKSFGWDCKPGSSVSTRPHMQKDRLHTSHVTDPVVRARIRWIMETLTYLQEKREELHEKKKCEVRSKAWKNAM